MFIDFKGAFDNVKRSSLFAILIEFGCSLSMLLAIITMYSYTAVILGTIAFTINVGVRQGAPSSGYLFVIFLDKLIRMIRSEFPNDGYLSWLSCLLYMDDLLLLSTSRTNLEKKFEVVIQFCNTYGMSLNLTKSKMMVINGDEMDKIPISRNNITINWCNEYIYLGCFFKENGNTNECIKSHADSKKYNLIKFINFLNRNSNLPFFLKKQVMESCFHSALFYSCETWFDCNLKHLNTISISAIKKLLNVRSSTPNDLVLCELQYPYLKYYVQNIQNKTYAKLLNSNRSENDDPFMFCYKLSLNANVRQALYIQNLTLSNVNILHSGVANVKTNILNSNNTKPTFYRTYINPMLTQHSVYNKTSIHISEWKRFSFTRFRLSSHYLAIEKGHWRRPITPANLRYCTCSPLNPQIQNEHHILASCLFTQNILENYRSIPKSLPIIFDYENNNSIVSLIHELLDKFPL